MERQDQGKAHCGYSYGITKPNFGFVEIDGYMLGDENGINNKQLAKQHQSCLQTVYVADASLMENIALATSKDKIDEACKSCCEMAGLDDYIMSLEDGYSTFLGEEVKK